MNRKTYTLCVALITAAIVALVGWSIFVGSVVLPAVAVVAGMALSYICRSRVTEVIEDERIYRISEKASRRTFQIFTSSSAVIGLVLILLRDTYPQFRQAGFTLAYAACALLILYNIFYGYYSRKSLD